MPNAQEVYPGAIGFIVYCFCDVGKVQTVFIVLEDAKTGVSEADYCKETDAEADFEIGELREEEMRGVLWKKVVMKPSSSLLLAYASC